VKYKDYSPENQKVIKSDVYDRWKQLNILAVNISERANKQLFIVNGAGAIASSFQRQRNLCLAT